MTDRALSSSMRSAFPADAAPLAVPYSTTTNFTGWNTFIRGDYQLATNNHLSFRWLREAVLTENDEIEVGGVSFQVIKA